VPLGTQGNLLGITGGEGTGKSNYVGSLIAGAIRKSDNVDTLETTIYPNNANKAVLLYDTEQSEVQLYKNYIQYFTPWETDYNAGLFQSLLPDQHITQGANASDYPKHGQILLSIWRYPFGRD
jgi:hypothetical protein